MIAHLAVWAEAERGSASIAFHRVSLVVANDSSVTAMAFPARIAGIDAGRDDAACMPGLVLCVAENAPLHPRGRVCDRHGANTCPFPGAGCPDVQKPRRLAVFSRANWTMRALTRCAICSSTCLILAQRSALSCSLSAMMPVWDRLRAMRPSSFAPCARYRCAISDEGSSQDGAVTCSLDAAHS